MGDSLQEVVGEPLGEERKQAIMMNYGYQMGDNLDGGGSTPVRSDQQHEHSSTNASRTTTSASSGGRPELVNKTTAKPRELQRRASGGDKPPMRDLLGDFMDADNVEDGKVLPGRSYGQKRNSERRRRKCSNILRHRFKVELRSSAEEWS